MRWWKESEMNQDYKKKISEHAQLHAKYMNEFNATEHDILRVSTKVGDESVEFSMYAPNNGLDIVTNGIRAQHSWEAGQNHEFHVNPNCKDSADIDGECGLFVDIGSNIGYWSLFMAHLGYDVISFEAMTANSLMLYATLQDLVPEDIKKKINLFPVALSNVTAHSKEECIVCSEDFNTQDGNLICGLDPNCLSLGKRYIKRETVGLHNLHYFLDRMYPAIHDKNAKSISNLKIDVEGHEPYILSTIFDIFDRGLIKNMIAECFGSSAHADFFKTQFGQLKMHLKNPRALGRCKRNHIVNLLFKRV